MCGRPWLPAFAAWARVPAAIDGYLLQASRRSAANPPHFAAVVDRRTNRSCRPLVQPVGENGAFDISGCISAVAVNHTNQNTVAQVNDTLQVEHRGASTFQSCGVQFLGPRYYCPSPEKKTLERYSQFGSLFPQLGVRPFFGGVHTQWLRPHFSNLIFLY